MLLILSPDVLLVVWQAALTMLSNSLMHWWLSFCGKGALLSKYCGKAGWLPQSAALFPHRYSKIMITAMQVGVSSSANTPHSFTGKALRGAQVPWVPTLLTSSAQSAFDSVYSK